MNARNEEMYGVRDINGYAANTMQQIDNTSSDFPELILNMIDRARYAIPLDPVEAMQTLSRIQFLITRHCPAYRAEDALAA